MSTSRGWRYIDRLRCCLLGPAPAGLLTGLCRADGPPPTAASRWVSGCSLLSSALYLCSFSIFVCVVWIAICFYYFWSPAGRAQQVFGECIFSFFFRSGSHCIIFSMLFTCCCFQVSFSPLVIFYAFRGVKWGSLSRYQGEEIPKTHSVIESGCSQRFLFAFFRTSGMLHTLKFVL